jgi:hypothetical protein
VPTLWDEQDLPFLRAMVAMEAESETGELPSSGEVAERAGLPAELGARVVDRLNNAGYIDAAVMRDGAGRIYAAHPRRVLERARRATGQWPSADPVERLVQLLEDRIREEPDEERRGALVRMRDAVVAGG